MPETADTVADKGRDRLWPAADALLDLPWSVPGLTVAWAPPRPLHLVSGALDAALAEAGIAGPPLGWPADAPDAPHALRLARDRALLVGAPPLAEGWHDGGFAVSAMTDGLVALDCTGDAVPELLARLGDRRFDRPSPTAALWLGGRTVPACRLAGGNGLRLYGERQNLPSLLGWMRTTMALFVG